MGLDMVEISTAARIQGEHRRSDGASGPYRLAVVSAVGTPFEAINGGEPQDRERTIRHASGCPYRW
jgi:hypothetical protein